MVMDGNGVDPEANGKYMIVLLRMPAKFQSILLTLG
jgi:hypothetical protein